MDDTYQPGFDHLPAPFCFCVPMLEKKYEGRPDWEEYKAKTAAFVPFARFL